MTYVSCLNFDELARELNGLIFKHITRVPLLGGTEEPRHARWLTKPLNNSKEP